MQAAAQLYPLAVPAETSSVRRGWLVSVGCLILLHLLLACFLPEQGWISCVGIGASYAMGSLLSVTKAAQSSGILRAKWAMLAGAFALRVGRDIAILYGAYVLRFEPQRAWVHSALFLLSGAPLLFVFSSTDDDDEPRAFAWLDAAQLFLISALILFDLFPGAYLRGGPEWLAISIGDYARLRDFELPMLLLLAAARMYAAVQTRMRFLYGTLIALLVPMPILNWLNDWVVARGVLPASPWFVLNDLPALAFVVMWTAGVRLPAPSPATSSRLWVSAMIRLGSPLFFSLAVLLLSLQAIPGPLHAGVWTSCAGLGIYGLRSAFLQLRHQQTQNRLISAQTELLAISHKDPLTEIYNRRWFDEAHRHEWARARRADQPISLLIVDIDHFKEFNDAAGHKAGDQCLIAVAGVLRKKLHRERDSISRYGGEEFAIILPNTDDQAALVVAQRLRQAVLDLHYPHPGASQAFVTVSVGVASLRPANSSFGPDCTSDELFLRADAALYQAKQQGRNRVQGAEIGPNLVVYENAPT